MRRLDLCDLISILFYDDGTSSEFGTGIDNLIYDMFD